MTPIQSDAAASAVVLDGSVNEFVTLWVGIVRRSSRTDQTVGFFFRVPTQEETQPSLLTEALLTRMRSCGEEQPLDIVYESDGSNGGPEGAGHRPRQSISHHADFPTATDKNGGTL